jgi:hypothetical protein
MPQTGHKLLLFQGEVDDRGEPALAGCAPQDFADGRVEDRFASREMARGEIARKFHSEELVSSGREAPGAERLIATIVVDLAEWREFDLGPVEGEAPGSGQVQTDFDAVGMKATVPFEGPDAIEVMPFDAETELGKIAIERAPGAGQAVPDTRFAERSGTGRV